MNIENKNDSFENQNWDFEIPIHGHEKRFLKKLKAKKSNKQTFWKPLAIACSLIIGLGVLCFIYSNSIINQSTTEVAFSPEVQETQDYFSSVINSEIASLKQKETPQSKVLIGDALKQMESLEKDYDNLKLEIKNNGENKQIVFALITNMQTRIDFLKSVLSKIETLNKSYHENSI